MRGLKRNPWLFGLGVLLAVLVVYGGHARADVTTDQSGSIIVFPKVIADGFRDTLIQIANTDTMPANAHCIYTNNAGNCSVTTSQTCNLDTDCPSGPPAEVCVHQCTEVNFDIFLTAQQPTTWFASTGRSGTDSSHGFPPGLIKPVCGLTPAECATSPFVGMLKCIETDPSGAPVAQNSLKGEAIIASTVPAFGEISEYNAVGIIGNTASGAVNGSNTLLLDGQYLCNGGTNNGQPCAPLTAATDCLGSPCDPTGAFNACPADMVLNSSSDGAVDSFTDAVTATELTLVPCTDLVEQQPPTGTHALAQFEVITDMERFAISASKPFDCMWNSFLSDINPAFLAASLGTDTIKTRIRPSSGKECYSGDNRCHFCTVNDPDPNCAGVNPGVLVGGPNGSTAGCDCSADTDCPNFVTAGTGVCALTTPVSCQVDSDCSGESGCGGIGGCTCIGGTCTPSPSSCVNDSQCVSGQSCSGPGLQSLGCLPYPGLIGVAEEIQFPFGSPPEPPPPAGTAAFNLHMEGSRPGDIILLP